MTNYLLYDTNTQAQLYRHPDPRSGLPATWNNERTPPDTGPDLVYIQQVDAPAIDYATQSATMSIDWEAKTQTWTVADLPPQELTPEEKLTALNAAYKAAVPDEYRTAFAPAWAIVRVLIQAGETQQAVDYITSLEVPPELEDAKTNILALFSQ